MFLTGCYYNVSLIAHAFRRSAPAEAVCRTGGAGVARCGTARITGINIKGFLTRRARYWGPLFQRR